MEDSGDERALRRLYDQVESDATQKSKLKSQILKIMIQYSIVCEGDGPSCKAFVEWVSAFSKVGLKRG